MNRLKSIGLYFVYPFVMFLLGIYVHMAYVNFFYPGRMESFNERSAFVEEEAVAVSEALNAATTCDTRLIVLEYDLEEGTEKVTEGALPEKYLGMNREQLIQALKDYEKNPTLEDVEKGFIGQELQSFSGTEVRIRKDYRKVEESRGYFLCVQDGKIVVMEEDMQTVYLTTDIYVEALSDALKQELIMGKFIADLDELYGFLESYTS